ncbi:MAG: pilus assembly protein TadG-related protein [Candidatus Dormibacteria bacterium]
MTAEVECDGQRRRERGQIIPLFALMLALLLLPVAGLAVDGGLLLSQHADLVGTSQAAAEAGAQAVDLSALESKGQFVLCGTPDGGADCGNGVGGVDQVVSQEVEVSEPALAGCHPAGLGQLWAASESTSGCTYALLGGCGPGARPTQAATSLSAVGVEVAVWHRLQLPLLSIAGWGTVTLRASSIAWMAHGFGPGSGVVGQAVVAC